MFKSFAGLWLLVFGPLFILLYPSSYNPIVKFNEHIEGNRFIEIYSGTFSLIESKLSVLPKSQWSSEISELSSRFGYDLALVAPSSLALNRTQRETLQAGDIVFVNAEPEYLLKRADDSDLVLQLFTDFSENKKVVHGAKGTVYLIQQAFDKASPSDWKIVIKRLSEQTSFNLRVKKRDSINLSKEEQQALSSQSFFWRGDASLKVTFYIDIKEQGFLLVADRIPMSSVDFSVVIYLILVFVVLISVCMFLWVYPLWRDLKKLVSATSRFGKGNLETRAVVSKNSVVATLGQTINQMAERTQQLLHSQKTLTNAIAHDLRTPLYRLRFAFEMLSETNNSDQELSYWSSISRSIDDLDHLVNQTLVLSRYSSDRQLVSFANNDIVSLTNEECIQTFQLHPDIRYQLDLHIDPDYKMTSIDSAAMRRALRNLLTNACKFASSFVEVGLSYEHESKEYVLTICDDGPGIEENALEKIFLPFEQLNNERRDITSGHGLGLAIVRHIASWHSGSVSAGNSSLGGAKFIFRWPAQ